MITAKETRRMIREEVKRLGLATKAFVDSSASGSPGPAGADGADGADFSTAPFIHLAKLVGVLEDVGGANGTIKTIGWDDELVTNGEFTHDTVTANHQVTVLTGGRYSIKATVSQVQGGTGRTTFMLYPTVNGTANMLGISRNYSRGSGYGDTSNTLLTEIELIAGDVLAIQSQVDDSDGTYVTYTRFDQCELIIRKVG